MHDNPLKFFDKILETLIVFPYTKFDPKSKNIEELFSKLIVTMQQNPVTVLNALLFLNSEGLVALDPVTYESFINTKGFIKIKTKGFVKQYNEAKWNLIIERFNKIATPIIAVSAFILGIINLLYKE